MVFIVPALIVLTFIGIRFQKNNPEENTYLNKNTTNCIRGFFIILIVAASLLSFIPRGSGNMFDEPLRILSLGGTIEGSTLSLGGLLFTPFFFYSGYGIFETFKNNGREYARRIPLQQILRHYLSYFIAWVLFAITALAMKYNYSIKDYLLSSIGLSTIGNENWFVFIMIFMYLFSFIAIRIADKKTAVIINIVLATFFLFLLIKFEAPAFCWNTTFAYLFGVIFSYLKERIEKRLFRNIINRFVMMIGSAILFISSLALIEMIPYGDFRAFMFAFPTLFFCMMIVGFTSIFQLRSRILNFIGANSFWIYIIYLLPFIWFRKVPAISGHTYLYFALTLVVAVLIAVVLNKVFNYLWNIFAKNHGDASEASNMSVGVALSYTTLVISALGAFVVTPRIVDYLGYGNYGLLSFANSITAWLAVISSALATSYIRFASKSKKEGKDIGLVNTSYLRIFGFLAIAIVLIVVGAVLVFILFDIQLPQYSFDQNRTILYLILVSGITVAINVMYSVFNSHLLYKKQFIFVRLLVLLTSFFTFMCNLIFAFISKNVLSISIVSMVMTSISTILTLVFAIRKEKMTFTKASTRETAPLIKAIIAFSSFVLLNSIVDQINTNLDKTILGIMVDENAVADYTFAKYFNSYFLILAISITMIYTPKIHELVANEEKENLSKLFLKISSSQMMVLFLVGGGFLAVGEEFMSMWLGPERSYIYLYAIAPVILDLFTLTMNSGIEIQRAMNKHKFRAILYICLAGVNIGVSILMIKILPNGYQVWGAFIGTILVTVVGNIIILNIYNKVKVGLPMGRFFFNMGKHCVYAGAGIGASLLLKYFVFTPFEDSIKFVLQGIIFVAIYFTMLLVFERATLMPVVKKLGHKVIKKIKGGAVEQ